MPGSDSGAVLTGVRFAKGGCNPLAVGGNGHRDRLRVFRPGLNLMTCAAGENDVLKGTVRDGQQLIRRNEQRWQFVVLSAVDWQSSEFTI